MTAAGSPPHHRALADGWSVWREVELRSAGLPAAWLAALGDPRLAAQLDADERDAVDAIAVAARAAAGRLHDFAREPQVREAVTWQNRRALRAGIDSLLRRPDGRSNSKDRQNEQLVASYVQRFCGKNERAGFFGASAPARVVDHGPALTMRPGDQLLARRATYLEPWAIDALADRLADDPELRITLLPRRLAGFRLDGDALVHAAGRTPLTPDFAAVFAACDGETPAWQIAERLIGADAGGGALGLGTPAEVYALLAELAEVRAIAWTLEVPTTGGPPEQLLRAELARLATSAARDRALAALEALEAARDHVSAAAGSATALDAAIDTLERTFVGLTGQASVRNAGESYAGRTIVGEDCARAVDVELGPALVDRIAAPLALILHSARWYTYEIARRYRSAFATLYQELRGGGPSALDYPQLYARLPTLFARAGDDRTGAPAIVGQVVDELHARWHDLLAGGSSRRVDRTARALRPGVAHAFAAPHPGWPGARHHSPDVLLAGASVDAINRGDYLAVLGELHAGMSSLLIPAVPNASNDPDAPFVLRDLDLGRACVAPVWSRRRSRLDYYSRSPGDFEVELSTARSRRPRAQVLQLAELVVDDQGGALVVRTRDHRVSFDIIAFHEHYLLAASFSEFSLLGGDHVPRVTIDGVVVSRERWVVPAAELAFAHAPDPGQRFVQARAWAQARGLPRRVFLKTPEETKPVYLDFTSPTFVELAAKLVRKATRVAISEMLPDLEELWLSDASGQRYTSELRLVAVDPEPWAPPTLMVSHDA